mmetsp:Transcript_11954/g.17544  ORF Transcript_11954/g.17544 Transcript_11954/m.17544 type:complete len:91 (-) Transcript_11954:2964-3236(-)
MLALKKKKEAAALAVATQEPGEQKVSLLGGIGGKKTSKSNDGANGNSKKRTPGEIRIQKGRSGVYCSTRNVRTFYCVSLPVPNVKLKEDL